MFEINLLNKDGIQINRKQDVEKKEENIVSQKTDNNIGNRYFLSGITVLIVLLFFYVFYMNSIKFNSEYHDISPANILSVLNINSIDNKIFSITNTPYKFQIIKEVSELSDIYNEQSLLDSLFNITSFISINDDDKKIYLDFNWYVEENELWNTLKLYEKLNSVSVLTAQMVYYQNKVILVADYNELINLFNILKSLNVDYIFKYEVELRDNSGTNYYKIIISEYD